jgi:hypothetical protein
MPIVDTGNLKRLTGFIHGILEPGGVTILLQIDVVSVPVRIG